MNLEKKLTDDDDEDKSETDEKNRKKPPVNNSKSKNLIKIKKKANKKTKQIFDQLTFVEEHQQTFYIGLNENINGVQNPMHAKEVDMEQAEELAKNWVKPDSQLVRREIKANRRELIDHLLIDEFKESKYKPLKFINEPFESPINENHLKIIDLFDQVNSTQMNDKDITILSPNKYKVYVADTPDRIKGLTYIERRMKGFNL